MRAMLRNPWAVGGAAAVVGFLVGRIVEYRRIRAIMFAAGRSTTWDPPPLEGLFPGGD